MAESMIPLIHPSGSVAGFSKDGQEFAPSADGVFLVPEAWVAELCSTLGLVPKPERLRVAPPQKAAAEALAEQEAAEKAAAEKAAADAAAGQSGQGPQDEV